MRSGAFIRTPSLDRLTARVSAGRRDVSLHTKSKAGRRTRATDTFTTIVETARKLGVSAYTYIHHGISRRCQLPALVELICERCYGPAVRLVAL